MGNAEVSRKWREKNPGAWKKWNEKRKQDPAYKQKHAEEERHRREKYKNVQSKINKARYQAAKNSVYAMFGGKCKHCGFSDVRALQIDHIEGLGTTTKARLRMGETGLVLYLALLAGRRDPVRYQLLCANCNWIKRCENNEIIGYKNKKEKPIASSQPDLFLTQS